MTALHTKLWRDLWRLRAQVVTIAVVVAIGVAGFVAMFSVHESLRTSRDAFYESNRLADVFAQVRRAPRHLESALMALDGVQDVQVGIGFDATIQTGQPGAPVTGRFIGLNLDDARDGRQRVNTLTLTAGRWPESGRALEALVNDRFAQASGLQPGDQVLALLNGQLEPVHIVGTAVSPEFVFASRGAGPDDSTFGIWWVDEERLSRAFDMPGAFNRLGLRIDPNASRPPLQARIDRLLAPYGSLGAVAREEQMSVTIVDNELAQLKVMGSVLPAIFLAVSMFILNVVVSRQVATQRSQIAALKALGYSNAAIARHYMQLAMAIAGLGVLMGLFLSAWIGRLMLGLYDEVFRFHQLEYLTPPWLLGTAAALSVLASLLGTRKAIWAVVRVSPAQAMQPLTPAHYGPGLLEELGIKRWLNTRSLMVLRPLERRPWRSALTVAGIAMAMAMQIAGAFWVDAIALIVDVQFRQVQQANVQLDFDHPAPPSVTQALLRLPGVLQAEAMRNEPVRVHHHGRSEDTVLVGLPSGGQLVRLVDQHIGPLPLPDHGVVVSALLAQSLGVHVGDTLDIEFRLWGQTRATVVVSAVVATLMGKQLYMSLPSMNRLARDGDGVTQAALLVDPQSLPAFWLAVKQAPAIQSVFDKNATLTHFNDTTSRSMGVFSGIFTLFAVAMAVGIVYNAARIALSERAWELASLRVLGMTRAEVSIVLLAPLALELLLALPLGIAAGWGLAHVLMQLMSSDMIDFPVVIATSTYASALLMVLLAGLASALLVRREVDRFDLVAVLKVRE
jgi:putative ABC transport system permease protein